MEETILHENREQNSLRYKNLYYLLKRGGKVALVLDAQLQNFIQQYL